MSSSLLHAGEWRRSVIILPMLTHIRAYLEKNPGAKAGDIARYLKVDKSSVNSLLYNNADVFLQGDGYQWFIRPIDLRIELGDEWLTSRQFERKLQLHDSIWNAKDTRVIFGVDSCKLMLEAQARLLALCNQLSEANKKIALDFKDSSNSSLSFLDRNGFFELLSKDVEVLPERPQTGRAQSYRGNNEGLIELRKIDPTEEDATIIELIHKSFLNFAGKSYDIAAFTILSELYTNVVEHSGTSSHGFAALQFYPGSKKIQVVISDNGKGIVGTLAPLLGSRYPDVAKKIKESSDHQGVALLKEIFIHGSISQKKKNGSGLGLKRSGDLAEKFRATFTVRQSDFELKVYHSPDGVRFAHWLNLARIDGTHICFDFRLDAA